MFETMTAAQVQATVATVALLVAIVTIAMNVRTQHIQTARKAHLDYINLAISNPNLATPLRISVKNAAGDLFADGESDEFEKYEWFVSYMLSTASYVWDAVGYAHPLGRIMIIQVSYHWEYLELYQPHRRYLTVWFNNHGPWLRQGIREGSAVIRPRPLAPAPIGTMPAMTTAVPTTTTP